MKRVFLTGEMGFIAQNLLEVVGDRLTFINKDIRHKSPRVGKNHKGEIDFVATQITTLKKQLKNHGCDGIIHNGAIVGTDVCGLKPRKAILNNVYGTFNIASIAKELNIPVVYIGTTVIYDTQEYQDDFIEEESLIFPRTLYATTKYEGELIIKAYCQESRYCILRPLFCYGGRGDMNSLIAKTIFNDMSGRKKPFKIFLDPTKIKDYMHVNDFCEAVVIAATNDYILDFNTDFNISADNPIKTHEIVEEIAKVADTSYIKWVPETDYLGNHMINNAKFKIVTSKTGRWSPKIELSEGIKTVCDSIGRPNNGYNPFEHLDKIEKNKINIETHYNFKG